MIAAEKPVAPATTPGAMTVEALEAKIIEHDLAGEVTIAKVYARRLDAMKAAEAEANPVVGKTPVEARASRSVN